MKQLTLLVNRFKSFQVILCGVEFDSLLFLIEDLIYFRANV